MYENEVLCGIVLDRFAEGNEIVKLTFHSFQITYPRSIHNLSEYQMIDTEV